MRPAIRSRNQPFEHGLILGRRPFVEADLDHRGAESEQPVHERGVVVTVALHGDHDAAADPGPRSRAARRASEVGSGGTRSIRTPASRSTATGLGPRAQTNDA